VTFGKKDTILIPPGSPALSDPIDLPVKDGSEIAISLYFPKHVASFPEHSLALRRAVISKHGDQSQDIAMTDSSSAVADLRSRWHALCDLDRARAAQSMREAGVSLRELVVAI